MALLAPKVIAQVNARSTGEVGVMSWEWIMRADGQVFYRLAKVGDIDSGSASSLTEAGPKVSRSSMVRLLLSASA